MALETELKYINADHDKIRSVLQINGGKKLTRHYERNMVLDDNGRTLYKRSALLRVRQADKITMTVKRIPTSIKEGAAKVYIEHETEVSSFEETISALEVLGYSPVFKYEKIREEWLFCECHICLDTLPFGNFIEIEGEEDRILFCAEQLGLASKDSCKKTYHELNRDMREAKGLPKDENFVFTSDEIQNLL